jgi:nicotinate-nucleotide adenylyltransferase
MSIVNVAIFGGSFNPSHLGHVLTTCYLSSLGKFDIIIVMPVGKHAHDKCLIPFHHRYEMCRLAMGWIPKVNISDMERFILDIPGHNGVNFTYETIQKIKELHPNWELHFVIGSDIVSKINNWKYSSELLKIASPFVIGRQGYEHKCNITLPEISSTQIREILNKKHNYKLAQELLPQTVYNYIVENNLFV